MSNLDDSTHDRPADGGSVSPGTERPAAGGPEAAGGPASTSEGIPAQPAAWSPPPPVPPGEWAAHWTPPPTPPPPPPVGGRPGGWGSGGWQMSAPHTSAPASLSGPHPHLPAGRARKAFSTVAVAAMTVVAVMVGLVIGHAAWGSRSTAATAGSVIAPSSSKSNVSSIAAKIDPALVDVNVTFAYQQARGAGTGIVLTSNGEVLTNNHVINGATSISVTDIGNGKTYAATVVGYDSTHDVAVLQLKGASGLKAATLANSAKLAVGQAVVAVGNAGGTGTPTAASGAITGLNQSITASDQLDGTNEQLSGLIQVNANVQSGDSGGALVNTEGEVVGMDTAASQSFSFQYASGTQGFAIPINQAIAIAKQIERGKGTADVHVGATAFLGVLISGSNYQSPYGSYGNYGSYGSYGNYGSATSGAVVGGVVSGGPAARAGLVAGDIITSFAGKPVNSVTSIGKAMVAYHPGDRVQVGWTDSSGQSHTATVQLASGPPA